MVLAAGSELQCTVGFAPVNATAENVLENECSKRAKVDADCPVIDRTEFMQGH